MAIWKLTPLDQYHRNWAASTFKGEVFVRADDERAARQVAASAFAIATNHVPGEELRFVPWRHSDNVACERMSNSEYDFKGPSCIVGPEAARRLAEE